MPDSHTSDPPPKRKGTNDVESHPAYRSCQVDEPPHKSIQSILRENSGERLYVPPICWTSRQLELLSCSFSLERVHLKRSSPPSKSAIRALCDRKPSNNPLYVIALLLGPATLEARISHVTEILDFYGLQPRPSIWLSFYFGQRIAADIRVDGVFSRYSTIPSLACITFETIRSLREKALGRKTKNTVLNNRRRIKLRSIDPQDPAKDPYIVSILIALAQAQRQESLTTEDLQRKCPVKPDSVRDGLSGTPSPYQGPTQMSHDPGRSFKVNVVATPGVVSELLYVYSASTPAEFLACLDTPSQSLPSRPVLVKYYCIPVIKEKKRKVLKELHSLLCTGTCILCASDQLRDPGATS